MPGPTGVPLARYASLSGFDAVCRDIGVDPYATMRAFGLDPVLLSHPDAWGPAGSVVAALESAATVSGCWSVGVRLAQRRTLSALGPVSLALREEPTLREALDLLVRFWPSYNEALRVRLVDGAEHSAVHVAFALDGGLPRTQAIELAAGVVARLSHARPTESGEPLGPVSVRFRHPPGPDGTDVQREFFGVEPIYGADVDAVDFRRADLDAVWHAPDAQSRAYARRFLETLQESGESRASHVRRLVEDLLPTGRCSAARVAAGLDVDRRTVHRWLEAEGHTFSGVVEEVRTARAEHLLLGGAHSHTRIAEAVGFGTPSSFSRWFSASHGSSPRAWLAEHRRADRPAPPAP